MKLIKVVIFSMLVSAFLVSCNQSAHKPNDYEVIIDDLGAIFVAQAFQPQAVLKNNTDHTLEITHGADIFTYEIYDNEDVLVEQENLILVQNDIGYNVKLEANQSYKNNGEGHRSKEYYQFILNTPGQYRLKAKAVFYVNHEGKMEQKEIKSSFLDFTVR